MFPSTVLAAEVTFVQNGASVTGTYRLPSFRWTGTLRGSVDATGVFSGTATIVAPSTPQVLGLSQGCQDSGTVRDILTSRDPRYITLGFTFPNCPALAGLDVGLDRTCRMAADDVNLSCS